MASTLYHTCKGGRGEALGQTKLAFDDLVNQLYAGQDPPGVEEAQYRPCFKSDVPPDVEFHGADWTSFLFAGTVP